MSFYSFTHILIQDILKEERCMNMKDSIRLNFEFPRSEYPSLKMLCAKQGLSLKDFATQLLIQAIEEAEDHWLAGRGEEVLSRIESGVEKTIPLEEVKKQVVSEISSKIGRKRAKATQKTPRKRQKKNTGAGR